MNKTAYSFQRELSTRYRFTSTGRKRIEKIVEFTPLAIKNIYNLGFGDLLPGKKIDDMANSNNGDIIAVLTTVIHIIKDFTDENPGAKIAFTGSTPNRTQLYERILRMYFNSFSNDFIITALTVSGDPPVEKLFNPEAQEAYLAFFVKRKI